jgi:hypothetical protein
MDRHYPRPQPMNRSGFGGPSARVKENISRKERKEQDCFAQRRRDAENSTDMFFLCASASLRDMSFLCLAVAR